MATQKKQYKIGSFAAGMARDSAINPNKDVTLYTLKNYRIIYTDGRLRIRKGYARWNATEMAATASQLYHFINLSQQERVLAIVDSATPSWWVIKSAGAHICIKSESATSKRPILTWQNRCFFGTDTTAYWTDYDSIDGANKSFYLGISKPETNPPVKAVATDGHVTSASASHTVMLNKSDHYRIGIPFTVTQKTVIGAISVKMNRREARQDLSGNIRLKIYTDDGLKPSTTLVDANAISDWMPVSHLKYKNYEFMQFLFPVRFNLEKSTKYWIVIESDVAYKGNFQYSGLTDDFYMSLGIEYDPATYTYGKVQVYNTNVSPSAWEEVSDEAIFYIGGLETSRIYDYVITYYNSTYGIESRPSPRSRIALELSKPAVYLSDFPASDDPQVNKIRIYRRQLDVGANIETPDDSLINQYYWVADVALSSGTCECRDTISTNALGSILQTEDHYTIRDTDDTGESLRSAALVPKIWTVWKGRVWFVENHSNVLYMSKKLEEDGASGLNGDMIPDFFPLENKIEVPMPSSIIGLRPLSSDQLGIYFENSSIWLLWGADEVLNPPSDISMREMVADTGLIAQGALDTIRSRHVYLARKGLYAFSGGANPEYLSEPIQSILDNIQDTYIDDSVIVAYGDEVWLLVDDDNDGTKESIFILDSQKSVPTWRQYDYGLGLNDFVVRMRGSEYKTILAADSVNKYILELEYGTTDANMPIKGTIETHNIRIPNRALISGVELDASYPYNPSNYEIYVIDNDGDERRYELNPDSSSDIRGHKVGCRVSSVNKARVRIEQNTTNEDEIWGLTVNYIER